MNLPSEGQFFLYESVIDFIMNEVYLEMVEG